GFIGLLVVVETICLQAGPALTQRGIDKGIYPVKDMTVIVEMATLYVLCVFATAAAWGGRVTLSGRVSARVMHDLRIRIFTHLQRMSLDYYTDEKAGVIMTRM